MLDHALAHPCHGPVRIAQELALRGIQLSSGGYAASGSVTGCSPSTSACCAWRKPSPSADHLPDEQIRLLERFSPEFRERYIEAPHTGALVAVDSFFVGVLKGVDKVYLQTAIDCHNRYAWARLHANKLPLTAVQTLNNDVLPTFKAEGSTIDAMLSDNGRKFCGREDQHLYELFLQLEDIEYKRTEAERLQSNSIVEPLHRTLLDEHSRVEGRRTWFETIDEMQVALDRYLMVYNTERPH